MRGTIGAQKTYVLNESADGNVVSSSWTRAQRNTRTRHESNTAIVIRTCERPIQRHGEVRRNKQGRSDAKHG